jgi:YggT family protein
MACTHPPPRLFGQGTSTKDAPLMTSLFQILLLLIDVAFLIVVIHIIMSWLINFSVLNLRQPLVAQIWHGLNSLVEPVYGPIRRRLPAMGGLDLAPLIVILGLYALEIILRNNAGMFL